LSVTTGKFRLRPGLRAVSRLHSREKHVDAGAAPGRAIDQDVALVRCDDAVDDREAQSGAPADGIVVKHGSNSHR
jgi:hypothetical protein